MKVCLTERERGGGRMVVEVDGFCVFSVFVCVCVVCVDVQACVIRHLMLTQGEKLV